MTPPSPPLAGLGIKSEEMSRTASENSNESMEPPKPKRKGTRSVASLTPSQLARKRANDREAQRAIRARTKEHIERLEGEVAELRKRLSSSFVSGVLEKNKLLEEEARRLRAILEKEQSQQVNFGNMANPAAPYQHTHTPPTTVFDDGGLGGQGLSSPRSSPYPNSAFEALEDLTPTGAAFLHMDGNPMYTTTSAASSPASSNQDDFASAGYIPASMAAPMGLGVSSQQQAAALPFRPSLEENETENMYASLGQPQYRHAGPPQHHQSHAQHQQHQHQHMSSQPQQQSAAWAYSSPFFPAGNNSMPPAN